MRKSVFILLTVFMACLLCKESGNRPDAPWKFTNETFLTRGGGGGNAGGAVAPADFGPR